MSDTVKSSIFLKWFEIHNIICCQSADYVSIYQTLAQTLSNQQLKHILVHGILKCYEESRLNDTIIYDIHSAIKDINVANNELSDKKSHQHRTLNDKRDSACNKTFAIDNLHFSILQYLDFKSLSICARINIRWLYQVQCIHAEFSTFCF